MSQPDLTSTAAALRLVVGRLARKLRRSSSGGLTLTQLSALASIEAAGVIRLADLAAIEGVSPPTLSRIVAGLSAAGHLNRRPEPADRRSSLVSLSATGRRVLETTRRERTAVLAERLGGLKPAELSRLRLALPVLQCLVDAFDAGTPDPPVHPSPLGAADRRPRP